MGWTSLCACDELVEGEGKYVEIDGFQLAIFRWSGSFYAMDSRCPHAGASLAQGHVEDGCAVCPLHGWAFRLHSGELREGGGPIVRTYECRTIEHERRRLVQAKLPMF